MKENVTAQKWSFSVRIWSHLLRKSSVDNFFFCALCIIGVKQFFCFQKSIRLIYIYFKKMLIVPYLKMMKKIMMKIQKNLRLDNLDNLITMRLYR